MTRRNKKSQNIALICRNVTYSYYYVPLSWWTVDAQKTILVTMEKSQKILSAREVFGQNLRRFRRLKDISQEELALRSELSRTYVSEVERGIRNVSIDNMGLLAEALGVELKELVDPKIFSSIESHLD